MTRSGSVKLTGHLVAAGARVLAAEPVVEMRQNLTQTAPGVRLVDATADHVVEVFWCSRR